MILSSQAIRRRNILTPFHERSGEKGLSYGLGPAGYDLRLDLIEGRDGAWVDWYMLEPDEFVLASAQEHFTMPNDLVGRVCDKSSLARQGLMAFNTVIEPGWCGFLTLELKNVGRNTIMFKRGQGIAQVLFELLDEETEQPYPADGKYQNQEAGPQGSRS